MSCSERTYRLLGLCARAGLCRWGTEVCREELRRDRSKAVVISASLSGDARGKLAALCRAKNVALVEIEDEGGVLGRSIGRPGVKVMSIRDQRFALRIKDSIKKDQESRIGGGA